MTTPTFTWIAGLSHGVATPTLNGGGICDSVTGSPTIQGSTKRTGNYALRCYVSGSAAATYIAKNPIGTPNILVGSFYFMWHTAPSADVAIFRVAITAGSAAKIMFITADKTLCGQISTNGTKTAALTVDTWYRVDFKFNFSNNPTALDLQLEGAAVTQLTYAQAGTTITGLFVGFYTAVTGEVFFDDIVCSQTGGDYPIGEHEIETLLPAADGTHNSGAVIKNTGGTVIDGTVGKTAYTELEEVPMSDVATYVQQSGTGTGNYAEVSFDQTTHTNILGVAAFLAYKAAGTSSNNGQTRIRDAAGQETTVYSGDMSESSAFYKNAVVTVPAAGWSQTTVNGLLGRVGYSSDASPVPWWCGLMLEVVYVPGTDVTVQAGAGAVQAGGISAPFTTGMNLPAGAGSDQASGINATAAVGGAQVDVTMVAGPGSARVSGISAGASAGITAAAGIGSVRAGGVSTAASTGVNAAAGVGSARAGGASAGASTGITTTAGTGSAEASGIAAPITNNISLAAGAGSVRSGGISATAVAGAGQVDVTVTAGAGSAGARGASAQASASVSVASGPGSARTGGISAGASAGVTAAAGVGNAAANGIVARASAGINVSSGPGSSRTAGVSGISSVGAAGDVTVTAGAGAVVIVGINQTTWAANDLDHYRESDAIHTHEAIGAELLRNEADILPVEVLEAGWLRDRNDIHVHEAIGAGLLRDHEDIEEES